MGLPPTETLRLHADGPVLHVTLNRPDKRNAMSLAMVDELMAVFAHVARGDVRIVVLRGAGGHFCSGGDVQDMARASAAQVDAAEGSDPIAVMNRRFGTLLEHVDASPAAVVAVCEGAVMGGGFGLACVADVTVAVEGARFRLPETSLGLPPAQIAPYVVQRLGLSQGRRLAVTGETLDAAEAHRLHLAHRHVQPDAVDAAVTELVHRIGRCEPGALAATKALVRRVGGRDLSQALDDAAAEFATFARSDTARAGFGAFLQRTHAPWDLREEP